MVKVLDWRRDIAEGLFWVGLSLLLSWLASPYLPERVPTHFNWHWQPDGWGSKAVVLWMVPALLMGLWGLLTLFLWLAATEKGQLQLNEDGRQWMRWIRSWMGVTLIAVHGSILIVGLGWLHSPRPILMPALGLLFLALGKAMPNLPRNWMAGVRLPWTIVDERVWKPVHRLAGWGFVAVGLGLLIAPLLPPGWDFVPLVGFVSLTFILIGYSYLLYRRLAE